MKSPPPQAQETPTGRSIGPDRVIDSGDSVTIYSARVMPDWEVREFCRIPIFFEGRKFYLQRRSAMDRPYAMGYELAPWPDDLHEESSLKVTYDARYVEQRERALDLEQRDESGRLVLLPLFPFLGYLWSRTKDDWLEPYGFNPLAISRASLLLSGAFVLIEILHLLAFKFGFLQTLFGLSRPVLDWIVCGVLLVDTVARVRQIAAEVPVPDGLGEWAFKALRRFWNGG